MKETSATQHQVRHHCSLLSHTGGASLPRPNLSLLHGPIVFTMLAQPCPAELAAAASPKLKPPWWLLAAVNLLAVLANWCDGDRRNPVIKQFRFHCSSLRCFSVITSNMRRHPRQFQVTQRHSVGTALIRPMINSY